MNRPTLIPGLPRLWRGPAELQLGSDPARALLLRLPDRRTARVLDLLDGTRSERLILMRAGELGVPAAECLALLETLHGAGLAMPASALVPPALGADSRHRLTSEAAALALRGQGRAPGARDRTPAQTLRRRLAARVVVAGHGRLGAPIAVALAESGVGHVRPEVTGEVGPGELAGGPLRGADVGRPRRVAIIEALSRAAPGTSHGVRRRPPDDADGGRLPDDVIAGRPPDDAGGGRLQDSVSAGRLPDSIGAGRLPDSVSAGRPPDSVIAGRAYRHRSAAALLIQLDHDEPATLRAATLAAHRQPHLAVTIREGAAVIGPLVPARGAPCLNCLELHRLARDASWPGAPARAGPIAEPCAVTTILAATAFATAEALTFLDGGSPETLGATVEITGPGRARRRTWAPHPDCGCGGH